MKKAAITIYAALLAFIVPTFGTGYVTYARLNQNAVLYNGAGEIICTLPESYYAVICGEESAGAYPVSYLDLSGYIKSSDITPVNFEPVTKFASATVRPNNDGMPVNLRSKPTTSESVILCSVPPDSELTLYGSRNGDELFSGAGQEWQYVKYSSGNGDIIGYVYSPQLTSAVIPPNSGEAVVKPSQQVTEQDAGLSLSRNGSIALAVLLSVPAGIIMLVLFYRPDSKRTARHSK